MEIFTVATFLLVSAYVWAGAVPGPNVVWMNLSKNPAPVDRKVERYLESGDDFCWNRGALMFMRSKPSGITFLMSAVARLVCRHEGKGWILGQTREDNA